MIKLPNNQSDLQKLVDNNIPEDIHLDYKASDGLCDKKKDEILKDISSFANSDGGILIYGIKEDKNNRTISIDNGINVLSRNWKEWLEQVVDGGIVPKISGIKINELKLDNGNFVYAIEIPKSTAAPHQSSDKKYYKRSNLKSYPMEHYEIEDVRNRSHRILPLVNVDIELQARNLIKFVISNQGDWTAENINFSMPDTTKNQFIKEERLPPIFSRGLKLLPPQKVYKFCYSLYPDVVTNEELKKTFIEVHYFHPQIGSERTERFDFDFEDFLNSSVEESNIAKLEKTLQNSFKNLNGFLKKISDNIELIAENTGQLTKLKSAYLSYFAGNKPNSGFYEYDCRVVDVINSSYSLFEQNLSRFIYFINNDKSVSEKLTVLPEIDFDSWYKKAKSTRSGMVGSGRLDFPQNELERISLLKRLFEEMATKKFNYLEILDNFMYKSPSFDDGIAEIIRLLFIPFARDIRFLLKKNN